MKRSQKLSAAVAAALGVYGLGTAAHATTAYFDDFNRTGLNTGTYVYTTTATAGTDGGADVGATFNGFTTTPNLLTLTNDATATANGNGYVYTTTPTSAYTGFNNVLSANTGNVLNWTFNLENVRSTPSGFGTGNYGQAYVLGATNGVFQGTGSANGYAVIIGNSGTPDPIKLVRFTGGLSAPLTTIATLTTQDAKTDFWSVKVNYDPSTNAWSLYTRDDGSAAFADPSTGTLILSGSGIDSTYTGVALTHSGALWSFSTGANQQSRFDNFMLDVSPPVADWLADRR